MTYDAKADGWATLFRPDGSLIKLPEPTTHKWWNKKKQVWAKLTHDTGAGPAMDELAKSFGKLEWPIVNAHPGEFDQSVEKVKTFMSSSAFKAFRKDLKALLDIAKSEAKVLKKKTAMKKSGEALDDVAEAAQAVIDATSPGSLDEALKSAIRQVEQEASKRSKGKVPAAMVSAAQMVKKRDGHFKAIREAHQKFLEDPMQRVKTDGGGEVTAQSALAGKMRALCRACTTPLGNVLKGAEAGVLFNHFDAKRGKELHEAMSVIADDESDNFLTRKQPSEAAGLIEKVERWTNAFVELVDGLEVREN